MPSWGNACETILSPYRHFERKREIFFRSRSSRRCGDSGISAPKPSPQGEGAPKGRIGQKRYERERGRPSQVRRLRKYPIHRWRGPPSPRGKATIREYRYLRNTAFPRGEGKEEAASPQKRKPTPPRCARQPLPREGARVDTRSFLWKEVPRRGGGWMGMAVSPTHSLPLVGKVPRRGG